jgi:hypothetical protein
MMGVLNEDEDKLIKNFKEICEMKDISLEESHN